MQFGISKQDYPIGTMLIHHGYENIIRILQQMRKFEDAFVDFDKFDLIIDRFQ